MFECLQTMQMFDIIWDMGVFLKKFNTKFVFLKHFLTSELPIIISVLCHLLLFILSFLFIFGGTVIHPRVKNDDF